MFILCLIFRSFPGYRALWFPMTVFHVLQRALWSQVLHWMYCWLRATSISVSIARRRLMTAPPSTSPGRTNMVHVSPWTWTHGSPSQPQNWWLVWLAWRTGTFCETMQATTFVLQGMGTVVPRLRQNSSMVREISHWSTCSPPRDVAMCLIFIQ